MTTGKNIQSFTGYISSALVVLSLAACGPLVKIGSDKPQPNLYSLQASVNGTVSKGGPVIYVSEPQLPGGAGGTQISVRTSSFQVSHLDGGRWSEPFRMMLHRYLTSGLVNQSSARFVGPASLDIKADCRLDFEFLTFEYNIPAGEVQATENARLLSLSDGSIINSHTFDKKIDVSLDSTNEIVAAFDTASGHIVEGTSKWMGANALACAGES